MDLLSKALAYHKFGWNILPLGNNEKSPSSIIPTWRRYQSERVTEEEIGTWFSRSDITGIVLVCGKISNVIVVDDDGYRTGNMFPMSSSLEAKTASGGKHLYFKYKDFTKSRKLKNEKYEIEVHSDGVLIVLPPSMAMNKKGEVGQYEWAVKEIKSINDLPEFNDFIIDMEFPEPEPLSTPLNELLEVEHGDQHNAMLKLMRTMLFSSDESSWESVVWPHIQAAGERYVKNGDPYPYNPSLLRSDWESAKEFVKKKKVERLEPKSGRNLILDRIEERRLEKLAPSTGYLSLDNLIKGFVPGHLYSLTAHTNVGKTSVSANFAINVARQGKKVLYFAFEPDTTILDYFASIAKQKPYKFIADQDIIDLEEYLTNIDIRTKDNAKSPQDIVTNIVTSKKHYDLIIIDHLGYFERSGTDSLVQQQSNTVKQLAAIAKHQQTAVLQIVHLNKLAGSIPEMKNISGSGAIYQDSTEVIILTRGEVSNADGIKVPTDTGNVIVSKQKAGKSGSFKIYFMPESACISDKQFDSDDLREIRGYFT